MLVKTTPFMSLHLGDWALANLGYNEARAATRTRKSKEALQCNRASQARIDPKRLSQDQTLHFSAPSLFSSGVLAPPVMTT